jgi:hypothetical protein
MATPAHYIIFHPDNQRDNPLVQATAISQGIVNKNWQGHIHVDKINQTNEDPFVFHEPWLYSYCHASQLKRVHTSDPHLQAGSWLFFVSGQAADQRQLAFDTVFLIGDLQAWRSASSNNPRLPDKYQYLMHDRQNPLYQRHLGTPFEYIDTKGKPVHGSVKYTYEADLWEPNKTQYSFLPLTADMQKPAIPLETLADTFRQKITACIRGKIPAPLTPTEQQTIMTLLLQRTQIQVVRSIRLPEPPTSPARRHGHHNC